MFFSAIKARGGFNNNPTAAQFESSYNRLLIHTELVVSSKANCLALDLTKILTVSRTTKKENDTQFYIDMICAEDNILFDDFEDDVRNTCTSNIIEYIAGFIVRKIQKIMVCDTCLDVLEQNSCNRSLISVKNKRWLKTTIY